MQGKLIVIDGSDASGKRTQTELLVKNLTAQGHKVKTLDFPQYDSFFGKLVGKYLRGEFGSLEMVKPQMASLLYAMDRFSQKENIISWISEGYVVVLDRYVESNMGYQAAKIKDESEKQQFLEWVEELEYGQLKLPKPDQVIYLFVPLEFSGRLIKDRPFKAYLGDEKEDIHEKDKSFQEAVVQSYIALCKKNNWTIISCIENNELLSKEEIAKRVLLSVIPLFLH